jgi:hypothetical protein
MTTAPTTSRRSLHAGRTLPILRSAGLFPHVASGDRQRFADGFRQTLRGRSPRSAANEVLPSWEPGPPEQVHRPTVELLPQLRRGIAIAATATGWVWAACGGRGQLFRFLARSAALLPSEIREAQDGIRRVRDGYKEGQLRSGNGGRVKGRKRALASLKRAGKDEQDDQDTGILAQQRRQGEEEERQRQEARWEQGRQLDYQHQQRYASLYCGIRR